MSVSEVCKFDGTLRGPTKGVSPRRNRTRVNLCTVAVCVCLVAMCVCISAGAEVVEGIVAVVNGDPILLSEFNRALAPSLASIEQKYTGPDRTRALRDAVDAVLRELIDQKLLLQEAERIGITVTEETIDEALKSSRARFDSDESFQKALAEQGSSPEQLRSEIELSRTITRLMALKRSQFRDKVFVSEQEIEERLKTIQIDFTQSKQVELWQIWIDAPRDLDEKVRKSARARCEKILQMLKDGADFETTARELSEGPEREQGGLIGLVRKGDMQPELDAEVFAMNAGEVSGVVESATGFHILRVTKVVTPETGQAAVRRAKAENSVRTEKMQEMFDPWIVELRGKANIIIR